MRRAITEWGLIVSLVFLVALGIIWADSQSLKYFQEPLLLGTDLYARVDKGRICLFSELGPDWKPIETGFEQRTISSVRRYENWFFPGIEYHNRLFASGRTIWSIEVSLVIPGCILLTVIALLWRARRGGWLHRVSAMP